MFTLIAAIVAVSLSMVSVGIVLADKSSGKTNPVSFLSIEPPKKAVAGPENPYFPALSAWDRDIQGLPPISEQAPDPQYAPSPVRAPEKPAHVVTGASIYPYDRRDWVLETLKKDAALDAEMKVVSALDDALAALEEDTYQLRSLAVPANVRPAPSVNSAQLCVLAPGKPVRLAGYIIGEVVTLPDGSFSSPVWFVLKGEQSVMWSGVFSDKRASGLPRYELETETIRSYGGEALYKTYSYQKAHYNPFA